MNNESLMARNEKKSNWSKWRWLALPQITLHNSKCRCHNDWYVIELKIKDKKMYFRTVVIKNPKVVIHKINWISESFTTKIVSKKEENELYKKEGFE